MGLERVKKGDTVWVNAGREKGKTGVVLEISTSNQRALVEKLNRVKKHMKPSQKNQQGGIVEKEAPLPFSVVMPFCPKCHKGVRVKIKVREDKKMGKQKGRVCAKCGEGLDVKK